MDGGLMMRLDDSVVSVERLWEFQIRTYTEFQKILLLEYKM
jgi:hypothetical protein